MALTDKAPKAAGSASSSWAAFLLPGYLISLALVFIGERIVSSDGVRYVCSGLGVLGAVGTTAVRFGQSNAARGERGRAERVLALCGIGGVAALAVYFATTETGKRILGVAAAKPETRARFEGAATVTWIALLLLSVLPLVFGELALAPMRRAAVIEARRVRTALRSGLVLACAALYCAFFTYGAGEIDAKADFSYFRTAHAGESTKNIASSTTEPIVVRAFFPELNEVGTEVMGYLREIARVAPNFKVEEHDRLLVPALAKEAKVTNDGVLVLTRGGTRETLQIGTDMKVAQGKLRTLDADFQKVLLKVMRSAHVAYLTIGHGEINEGHTDAAEGRTTKNFRKLLENQNYTVKDLGILQGLGTDVPADATVVIVLGPAQPFAPEEIAALQRYADRGGHLLLALDPEAKVDLEPLAHIAGLSWSPTLLATDKPVFIRRRNKSDRGILATNRFSSHASVSTLSRNSTRAALVVPGASSLDKAKDAPGDLKIDFAVKSLAETFEDKQGTFEYDGAADGRRNSFNLAAAVSKTVPAPAGWKSKDPPELRAFVMADADALTDAAFGREENIILAGDVIRWLGGEESWSGAITTTEDARVEHTKPGDTLWFYATILGAPLCVLGVGMLQMRRGRRRPATKTAKEEKGA